MSGIGIPPPFASRAIARASLTIKSYPSDRTVFTIAFRTEVLPIL
jgi:hypothetical protein